RPVYSVDFTASPSLARRAKVLTKSTIGKPEKRATSKRASEVKTCIFGGFHGFSLAGASG
ncbi:MAG TPA: hypothetical protein VGY77_05030, partial [Gemmataceae bacterium]|nr:hypothetical protein [Gemmataceae bacterium]